MEKQSLLSTGNSFRDYYKSINKKYLQIFDKYYMLHYPFFNQHGESLEERQINLSDFCISEIPVNGNDTVLDVGCGNGVQSVYLAKKLNPTRMMGVDINEDNIQVARQLNGGQVVFQVDDAQQLASVENESVDILVCVESAFHYPDKKAFIQQIHRVLKPNGFFLIADILAQSYKKRPLIGRWKRKMFYYHWTLSEYEKVFEETDLKIKKQQDITDDVIRGYSGHASWVKSHQFAGYFQFLLMRTFIAIQVVLNVYLLKNRRIYMIFTGVKG